MRPPEHWLQSAESELHMVGHQPAVKAALYIGMAAAQALITWTQHAIHVTNPYAPQRGDKNNPIWTVDMPVEAYEGRP